MKSIISLLLLIFVFNANAQVKRPSVYSDSRKSAPEKVGVLQCPQAKEITTSFYADLANLKASIEKVASCKPLLEEVDKIGLMFSNDKKKGKYSIYNIVKAAQTKPIDANSSEKLQEQVAILTNTATSVFRAMQGDDACFKKDKKATSLAFISSLLGEAVKVFSALDPTGGTIPIVGNVLAGVLEGFATMRTVGYDFKEYTQVAAYNTALCEFYDFQKEINAFLYPELQIEKLYQIDFLLAEQETQLLTECEECNDLVSEMNKSISESTDVPEWSEKTEEAIQNLVEEIDKNTSSRFANQTLSNFESRNWISLRIETLSNLHFKADLEMQEVLETLIDMEDFLVRREGRDFLNFQKKRTLQARRDLHFTLYDGGKENFRRIISGLKDKKLKEELIRFTRKYPAPGRVPYHTTDVKTYLKGAALIEDNLDALGIDNFENRSKVATYLSAVRTKAKLFEASAQNFVKYCDFFLFTQTWYNPTIAKICEQKSQTKGYKKPNSQLLDDLTVDLLTLEAHFYRNINNLKPTKRPPIRTSNVRTNWAEAVLENLKLGHY